MREPNGLLAVGGDLAPTTLVSAYAQGIFPWFSDDEDILWWTPLPAACTRVRQDPCQSINAQVLAAM